MQKDDYIRANNGATDTYFKDIPQYPVSEIIYVQYQYAISCKAGK